MPYLPLNVSVYTAAFAGAMAAMCNPVGAAIIDPATGDYAPYAAAAAAWAQAIDIAWTASPANSYDLACLQNVSTQLHNAHPIAPNALPAYSTVANWTIYAQAVVAAVRQGDVNLGTQNITPPSSVGANRADCLSSASTTPGAAATTIVLAMKLIAKTSGIFHVGYSFIVNATAADVVTTEARIYTDAVPGTPLTLGNATLIGPGSNGVALPGNVPVINNGIYGETAGTGITIAGATVGYIADNKAVVAGGAMAVNWNALVGKGQIIPSPLNENAVPIGQTCLVTVSLANTVAARALGSITAYMFELNN